MDFSALPAAVIVAIVTGIINGIVSLAVMAARLDALKERMGHIAGTADKAHARIDDHVKDWHRERGA